MTYARLHDGTLDYEPCRYGRSKLTFRGPKAGLDEPYVAFLGGTVAFGKFVERPYPVLIGEAEAFNTVNLGCMNAGVDSFREDPSILDICRGARACVVHVMGAHELSNRYYQVHPRRNDRFIGASPTLRSMYPDADFSEVHFARHLLRFLRAKNETLFRPIVEELCLAWTARMKSLLQAVEVPVILLWVSDRSPDDPQNDLCAPDPLFVTREMIDDVRQTGCSYLEIVGKYRHGTDEDSAFLSNIERQAARFLPGPDLHRQIAAELPPALTRLI